MGMVHFKFLLQNTCLYFARKSEQERQAAGPYPYSHLLDQIDHPDFLSPSASAQPVEKTDEFAYSDLSEFFVMVRFNRRCKFKLTSSLVDTYISVNVKVFVSSPFDLLALGMNRIVEQH